MRILAASLGIGVFGIVGAIAACSSDATPGTVPGGDGGLSAKCSAPGGPAPGPTDTHCQGKPAQKVSSASCTINDAGASEASDGGADGGAAEECEYGPTQFGTSGTDDDCKYILSYTSDPICEGAAGIQFTVTVKNATDNSPVTGISDGINVEAFIPTDPNAACDAKTTHPSPSSDSLKETAVGSGVYKGAVVFDAPGLWTVRFHIHEECFDILDDSPHGHIAFRFNVP